MKLHTACLAVSLLASWMLPSGAAELHVSLRGADANPGTAASPFRTIQQAATAAMPGDVVTVHEGVYRERVNPPRGGRSDHERIVYQAAPGEHVELKGSEVVGNWTKVQDGLWKVVLPNSFFGKFNPYADEIHGNWFNGKGRKHHTGAVYLNGAWLAEAAKLDDVLKASSDSPLWFGQVDATSTTIWAQFKQVNPNEQSVEINVRQTVFYPDRPGRDFITVRGFTMRHAATQWAPPTAEQIGLIGPHWSKGWIIENNTISHSVCTGISLGKYGDEWDNKGESVDGYINTVRRALDNGWNPATVGHHIVRNNEISHCEQAGIVGSFGASYSVISDNRIHDIHVRRLFAGPEVGGIKFHGGVDVVIRHNHIYRTLGSAAVWLDWMGQGAQITGNLLNDNSRDLFLEVNHGPILVDNNIFLSPLSLHSCSRGVAFAHNLFGGSVHIVGDGRVIPFLKPHGTEIVGFHAFQPGDDRYYNNIFASTVDMRKYDGGDAGAYMEGNVFLKGATPSSREASAVLLPDFDAGIKLVTTTDGCELQMSGNPQWQSGALRKLVTSQLLGKAQITGGAFEQPDGSAIRLDTDYLGRRRNDASPAPV